MYTNTTSTGPGAVSPESFGSLTEWRQHAAVVSAGTSSNAIKRHVLSLLERHQPTGRLLDFGAGTGELIANLLPTGRYARLVGIDLFDRPAWLPPEAGWVRHDLNEPLPLEETFDAVVCSEVIEHLENPRQVFRTLRRLVAPGGLLVLTTPNTECVRALAGLLLRGHFTPFLVGSYPAHITALVRMDLERLCAESGFAPPTFSYPDDGAVPKLTGLRWSTISFGLLRGRLFSDTVALHTRPTRPST